MLILPEVKWLKKSQFQQCGYENKDQRSWSWSKEVRYVTWTLLHSAYLMFINYVNRHCFENLTVHSDQIIVWCFLDSVHWPLDLVHHTLHWHHHFLSSRCHACIINFSCYSLCWDFFFISLIERYCFDFLFISTHFNWQNLHLFVQFIWYDSFHRREIFNPDWEASSKIWCNINSDQHLFSKCHNCEFKDMTQSKLIKSQASTNIRQYRFQLYLSD